MSKRVYERGDRFAQVQPPIISRADGRCFIFVREHDIERETLLSDTATCRSLATRSPVLEKMSQKATSREWDAENFAEMRLTTEPCCDEYRPPRRSDAFAGEVEIRRAPKPRCAMRTGSFHQTTSCSAPLRSPCPNPVSGSMDNARVSASSVPRLGPY
jgi:hypothetical protein